MINANRNLAPTKPSACRCGPTRWPTSPARWPASGRAGALRDALARHRALRHAALSARSGRHGCCGAAAEQDAEIAMAAHPRKTGKCAAQPVFCLLRADRCWTAWSGSRRPAAQDRRLDGPAQRPSSVPFDRAAADDTRAAFFNVQHAWPTASARTRLHEKHRADRLLLQGYDPNALPVAAAKDFMARLVDAGAAAEERRAASALGRVLAHDIVSPIDVPPHDNSAMDGYALRGADLQADARPCCAWLGTGSGRPRPGDGTGAARASACAS